MTLCPKPRDLRQTLLQFSHELDECRKCMPKKGILALNVTQDYKIYLTR